VLRIRLILGEPLSRLFLAACLLINLLSTTLGLFPTPTHAASQTISVPEDFETIQAAVNTASPGDTIQVAAGIYYECVTVNKTVTLIGEDPLTTIIDGIVFVKNVSNVVISRFTIRNGGDGIFLEYCTDCTINGNIIKSICPHPSILLEYSEGNVVYNNSLLSSCDGIGLFESNKNVFANNKISDNTREGIRIVSSKDNVISANEITGNREWGISLLFDHTHGNIIKGNTVSKNYYGIVIQGANGNAIYHNNFINNTHQIYMYGNERNMWDDGYPFGGNYWSDYNGTDLHCGPYQDVTGSDGIGDTPYVIDEYNKDRYPFVNPWVPKVLGDINSDGITDIFDLTIAATAFASKPGYPNWNPDTDVYTDRIIDIFDFVIIAVNYGKTAEDP